MFNAGIIYGSTCVLIRSSDNCDLPAYLANEDSRELFEVNGLPVIRFLLRQTRYTTQPAIRITPPNTPPIIALSHTPAESGFDEEDTSAVLPVGCTVGGGCPGPLVEGTPVSGVIVTGIISINKVVGCLGGPVKIGVVADAVSAVWVKVTVLGDVLGAGNEPVGPDAATSVIPSGVGPMSTGSVV